MYKEDLGDVTEESLGSRGVGETGVPLARPG